MDAIKKKMRTEIRRKTKEKANALTIKEKILI
jgi:hypothetical protein